MDFNFLFEFSCDRIFFECSECSIINNQRTEAREVQDEN